MVNYIEQELIIYIFLYSLSALNTLKVETTTEINVKKTQKLLLFIASAIANKLKTIDKINPNITLPSFNTRDFIISPFVKKDFFNLLPYQISISHSVRTHLSLLLLL